MGFLQLHPNVNYRILDSLDSKLCYIKKYYNLSSKYREMLVAEGRLRTWETFESYSVEDLDKILSCFVRCGMCGSTGRPTTEFDNCDRCVVDYSSIM